MRKEFIMGILYDDTNIHTHAAIEALKHAYEKCSDTAAKESVITAFKSVIQLHYDLGKHGRQDSAFESNGDHDPSEYCAAV